MAAAGRYSGGTVLPPNIGVTVGGTVKSQEALLGLERKKESPRVRTARYHKASGFLLRDTIDH